MGGAARDADAVAEAVAALPRRGLAAAFAYGSGVFEQIAARPAARAKAGEEEAPLVDLVLVVDDAADWHRRNMKAHPAHYSCLASLGPEAVAKVQRAGGGYMYFNTDVVVPSAPGIRLKYGVISQEDAVRDLCQWTALYLSGRLHKPVRFVVDAEPESALRGALRTNLVHAMHTALLMLPPRFDDQALFHCISELSYAGDVRMGLAENPDKVANIVRGSMPHFQTLYSRFLPRQASAGPAPGFEGDLSFVSENESTGLRTWEQNMDPALRDRMASTLPFLRQTHGDHEAAIREALRAIVRRSSRVQSAKGVLTVGTLTAFRYGMRKVRKRFGR